MMIVSVMTFCFRKGNAVHTIQENAAALIFKLQGLLALLFTIFLTTSPAYGEQCDMQIRSGFRSVDHKQVPFIESDLRGVDIIQPAFYNFSQFSEGLAAVEINGRAGYINTSGQIVIPAQFDNGYDFHEGLALVSIEGKLAYIDRTGKKVIQLDVNRHDFYIRQDMSREQTWNFHGQIAMVMTQNGKFRYLRPDGRILGPIEFDRVWPFVDDLAAVQIKEKLGFVNKNGESVIAPRYEDASSFQGGLAAVTVERNWGFIDRRGELLIQPQFEAALPFQNGLARVAPRVPSGARLQWGMIDVSGRFVIEPKFSFLQDFDAQGHAAAEVAGKIGFIDRSGSFVVNPQYTHLSAFHFGLAHTSQGYIDETTKQVVLKTGFPVEEDFGDDGFAMICADYNREQCGFIDRTGNVIVKPQFRAFMLAHSESWAALALGPIRTEKGPTFVTGYFRLRACGEKLKNPRHSNI